MNLTTALPIAREVFPDLETEELISILWNRTGYPIFWVNDPLAEIRKQLTEFKEAEWRESFLV